jgi:hypothetical protein
MLNNPAIFKSSKVIKSHQEFLKKNGALTVTAQLPTFAKPHTFATNPFHLTFWLTWAC